MTLSSESKSTYGSIWMRLNESVSLWFQKVTRPMGMPRG